LRYFEEKFQQLEMVIQVSETQVYAKLHNFEK
jgi:hypothetical protein